MHMLYQGAQSEAEANEVSFFVCQECYNAALDTSSWVCTLDVFSSMLHGRRRRSQLKRET